MKSDNLTFQVQFWGFIGPFICLLSLFIFYIKGEITPDYFPILLLIGMPLCWKWRLQGFTVSVILLSLVLAYYYFSIPLEERFWHLGMGTSIIVSLLITALSFEEVDSLVEGIKLESRSRLENLWKVDEKLQQAILELKKKKERIRELNIKTASYQKLLDRSTEETVDLREELQRVQRDKEELVLSLSRIRSDTSLDAQYQNMCQELEEKQRLVDEIRKELFLTREQLANLQKEQEEMKMYELSEVEDALQKQLLQTEMERERSDAEHQQELEALQEVLTSALKKEN